MSGEPARTAFILFIFSKQNKKPNKKKTAYIFTDVLFFPSYILISVLTFFIIFFLFVCLLGDSFIPLGLVS